MLPKGGIALFEEPELHLNPGIQQKLADFFLEICKSDRQIIAETHSEYIVTRLRRRASESSENSSIFTFVFTELDDASGTSYRSVAPDDQGMINNWPAGFFDQVSGDVRALLLNTAEKREQSAVDEE
jgi:predicted ATPase